jgi:hypothetical protein
MATGYEPPSPGGEAVDADEIEVAERRVNEARERAAHAGLEAARSFEESANRHERVAEVQDRTIEQGASHDEVHRRSAGRHRKAAVEDRHLADQKRKESEADLSGDISG